MYDVLGMIVGFAGVYAPRYWAYCDGQQVSAASDPAYVKLVGDTFGGDGANNAATPNLANFPTRNKAPVRKIINVNGSFFPYVYYSTMASVLQAVAPQRMTEGGNWLECMGQSLDAGSNRQLYSVVQNLYGGQPGQTFDIPDVSPDPTLDGSRSFEYLMCAKGAYPGTSATYAFVGQVQYSASLLLSDGWARCNGSERLVSQSLPLFNVIGSRYGGDGRTTFNLPNLLPVPSKNGGILYPIICTDGIYPPYPE